MNNSNIFSLKEKKTTAYKTQCSWNWSICVCVCAGVVINAKDYICMNKFEKVKLKAAIFNFISCFSSHLDKQSITFFKIHILIIGAFYSRRSTSAVAVPFQNRNEKHKKKMDEMRYCAAFVCSTWYSCCKRKLIEFTLFWYQMLETADECLLAAFLIMRG